MPTLIRPAAAADIEEAFLWYERQQAGLGEEFLRAVQSALENIAAHPIRYPVVHRETRRVLVRRLLPRSFPVLPSPFGTSSNRCEIRAGDPSPRHPLPAINGMRPCGTCGTRALEYRCDLP